MITKMHQPNDKLKLLQELNGRILLSKDDCSLLYRYTTGYNGEKQFFKQIMHLENIVILWDIYLEDYSAQFDFLLITQECIIHIDVKNYSGVYEYFDGLFKSENGRLNKRLMSQLITSEEGLKQFLTDYGFKFNVMSRMLFINESFQLMTGSDKRILFYYDVPRVVDYLKNCNGITESMLELSDTLIDFHRSDAKFIHLDEYDFNRVKPGVRCPECRHVGMMRDEKRHKYRCRCGNTMSNREAVAVVFDMLVLFGVQYIRKCDINRHLGLPDRTIKRILNQQYCKHGSGKQTYYTKRMD